MPTLEQIRARFPALASPTVFLDNAGGSQLPIDVIDALTGYLRRSYAQLGGEYPESRRARATVDGAHAMVKVLVGCPTDGAGEVILGPSTSALCNMLAQCYAEAPGDRREVVVCTAGHESNVGPWLRLESRGWTVRKWDIDPGAQTFSVRGLQPLLSSRTRLVVFPHVSNILGQVVDAPAMVRAAHQAGARVVIDGVAYAPHHAPDVAALGCDYYVFSTYKVFGPHMAAMYGARAALAELTGPNHYFVPRDSVPYKFELGGVNHEGCAAVCGLAGYLRFAAGEAEPASGMDAAPPARATVLRAFSRFAELERAAMLPLLDYLRSKPGVRIIGPAHADDHRVATVSFVCQGRSSRRIAEAANAEGLAIRYGHFYSRRLLEQLGLEPDDGVVRVSLVHYNTPGEVARLLEWLDRALGMAGV